MIERIKLVKYIKKKGKMFIILTSYFVQQNMLS